MNKKNLVLLIRKIIKEEISKEMTEMEKKVSKAIEGSLKEIIDTYENTMAEVPKIGTDVKSNGKSKNNILREIESEISGRSSSTNLIEWNTGNSKLDEALSVTTKTIPQSEGPGVLQEATGPSVIDNPNIPDHVRNAVTRDYSELMNAMNKKSGA